MVKFTNSLLLTLLKRFDFIAGIILGTFFLATTYYLLLIQTTDFYTLLLNLEYEPIYKAALFTLVPITILLFGLNFSLVIFSIRAKSKTNTHGTTLFGALLGGFGTACPACGAFLLSLVGVTAGLTAFPLGGLEFWGASTLIVGYTATVSLKKLDKDICELDKNRNTCWILPKKDNMVLNQLLIILILALLTYFVSLVYENDLKKQIVNYSMISGPQCALTMPC